jgi:hypothetical protein
LFGTRIRSSKYELNTFINNEDVNYWCRLA